PRTTPRCGDDRPWPSCSAALPRRSWSLHSRRETIPPSESTSITREVTPRVGEPLGRARTRRIIRGHLLIRALEAAGPLTRPAPEERLRGQRLRVTGPSARRRALYVRRARGVPPWCASAGRSAATPRDAGRRRWA